MNNEQINESMTFESALKRLETIVHTLEEGSSPLEASLSAFEEGIGLVKFCNEQLDRAEQKVKLLTVGENGSVSAEDFKVQG